MKVIAHGGASALAASNTMEAIEKAIQGGAGGVEINVLRHESDQFICAKPTETGDDNQDPVRMPVADLSKRNIPFLSEVLKLSKNKGCQLILDIKSSAPGVISTLASMIADQRFDPKQVYFGIRLTQQMVELRKVDPKAKMLGLLEPRLLPRFSLEVKPGHAVRLWESEFNQARASLHHGYGQEVWVMAGHRTRGADKSYVEQDLRGPVTEPGQITPERLRIYKKWGASGIIVNDPEAVIAELARQASGPRPGGGRTPWNRVMGPC